MGAAEDPQAAEIRGWGPALLLCLLAWVASGIAASAIPGAGGWLAGLLALFALPAGWLVWQLRQPPPERGGPLPSA